jgi:hypothetical protein
MLLEITQARPRPRSLACCALLTLLAAGAVKADALSDIYQRLQQQPQSLALNLQYAMEAEKIGKVKWALPAYERALAAQPGNQEALRGIGRIRDKLRAEADAR